MELVHPDWRIEPDGDRCLIVEFGRQVDLTINGFARAFADLLREKPIIGIIDVVPAFTTVAIHYRPEFFVAGGGLPFQILRATLDGVLERGLRPQEAEQRIVDIPVVYGGDAGADLAEVAASCGLSEAEVIARHVASEHVVYMLGFAPGFPYIGGLDPTLSVPRRATPRTRIPAGSVAIARDQTAIYSIETPGGWNLIGRTPLVLFDPLRRPPCLLQAGDRVRFVPVDRDAVDAIAGELP